MENPKFEQQPDEPEKDQLSADEQRVVNDLKDWLKQEKQKNPNLSGDKIHETIISGLGYNLGIPGYGANPDGAPSEEQQARLVELYKMIVDSDEKELAEEGSSDSARNEKFGEATTSAVKTMLDKEAAEGRIEQLDEARRTDIINESHHERQEEGKERFLKETIIRGFGEQSLREKARVAKSKEEFLADAAKRLLDAHSRLSIFRRNVDENIEKKVNGDEAEESVSPWLSRPSDRMLLMAASEIENYAGGKEEIDEDHDWRDGMQNWHEASNNAQTAIEREGKWNQDPKGPSLSKSLEANPGMASKLFKGLSMIAERTEDTIGYIYDEEKELESADKDSEAAIMALYDKYKDHLPKEDSPESAE